MSELSRNRPVRAYVCVCVCACVRACVRVCVCVALTGVMTTLYIYLTFTTKVYYYCAFRSV